MAEHELQPLMAFLTNIISDITENRLNSEEAVVACSQYSILRDALASNATILAETSYANPDNLIEILLSILTKQQALLSNQLLSFQGQLPDQEMNEADVRTIAGLRTDSQHALGEWHSPQRTSYEDRRKAFIHELVTKFSRYDPQKTIVEEKLVPVLDKALVSSVPAARAGREIQESARELQHALVSHGPIAAILKTNPSATEMVTAFIARASTDMLQNAQEVVQEKLEAHRLLYQQSDIRQPDIFVHAYTAEAANPKASRKQAVQKALVLAGAAGALTAQQKFPTLIGNHFFQTFANPGPQQGFAQVGDAILSILPVHTQDRIKKAVVTRAFDKVISQTYILKTRLGDDFAESEFFRTLTNDIARSLAGDKAVSALLVKTRGVMENMAAAILVSPMAEIIFGSPREQILRFFELAKADVKRPVKKRLFPIANVPVWEQLYRIGAFIPLSFLFPKSSKAHGESTTKFVITTFPVISWIIAGANRIGASVSSWLNNGITNVLSGPGIPLSLLRVRRAMAIPIPLATDLPKLIALVVIVAVVALFIIPWPLNTTSLIRMKKVSSLFSALVGVHPGGTFVPGAPIGKPVFFVYLGDAPVAAITECPRTGGYVSNVPFAPSTEHAKGLNAYDIAGDTGTPVYATHNAYVVSYEDGYGSGFVNGSYGNNVVLVATDPVTGEKYFTLYGHLETVSPIVAQAKDGNRTGGCSGDPKMICAGEQIGTVDATGTTYTRHEKNGPWIPGGGTHLHYEHRWHVGSTQPSSTTFLLEKCGYPLQK